MVILFPDGSSSSVDGDEALELAVDAWYDANPDSEDDPTLQFPIEVSFEDGETETVNDEEELDDLWEDWLDEEHGECFELVFPLSIDLPGQGAVSVANEEELENVVEAWFDANPDSEDDPDFVYPSVASFEDGTVVPVADAEALEELLEECYDECDIDGEDVSMGIRSAVVPRMVYQKR